MRTAQIKRTTAETDISLTLNLDGRGMSEVNSGCGFLDHMLTLFAKHGRFDLTITCKGDVEVDFHQVQGSHFLSLQLHCLLRTFHLEQGRMEYLEGELQANLVLRYSPVICIQFQRSEP